MKVIVILFFCFALLACNRREVKHSGLNDLFFGVHQIILFENKEFYLELGMGGVEGRYEIRGDTVFLKYDDRPKGWPDKFLITEQYFESIDTVLRQEKIRIARIKN